jgi:HlyD family secretion protein
MPFFSQLVRYGTIGLALAGVFAMMGVLELTRAQDKPITPPPVEPPQKPYDQGLAATGILEALDENVQIGTPVPGLVTQVHVKVWDKVKAGAPLFQLDDRELSAQQLTQQASISVQEASITVAKAQLMKMQDMLTRLKSVADPRAISQDDLKNRGNDVSVAQAQLTQAEAQLSLAKANLQQTQQLISRLTVCAPRAGSILQVNIRAGEYSSVQSKQVALILGDVDTLQVRTDVDEQNAKSIRPGQRAKAFLKSNSQQAFDLEFIRIEPFVIPKQSLTGASTERVDTRVLQVIYRLKKPSQTALYVGQQVDVFIQDSESR